MEVKTIYEYQLEVIVNALRLTNNLHKSSEGKTCFDRQVREAYEYAKNAMANEKEKQVNYMTGKSSL